MITDRCCIVVRRFFFLVLFCSPTISQSAETLALRPEADTTLIEAAPGSNLGGADFINAGTTGSGNRNRALVRYNFDGQVPAGAIIESVTLTLDIVRQPSSDGESTVFGLHRVNVSWGEGVKVPEDGSPGLGNPATAGEATWLERFAGGAAWEAPGGAAGSEFAAAASSAALVFGVGDQAVFETSSQLLADVQHWLDHPDQNFGWMLMTESEEVRKSARGFASRENEGAGGPLLEISYVVVPEPGTTAVAALGLAAGGAAWLRRVRRIGRRGSIRDRV